MKNTTQIITVNDAIYDVIHHSALPAKAQAEALGISYSRFLNSCLDSSETAYHHTRWIIPQTLMSKNYTLIDFIERALGRVAVPVFDPTQSPALLNDNLNNEALIAVRELSEMVEIIRLALKDQKIDKKEEVACLKKTWDLVIQALKVYATIQHLARKS